MIKKQDKQNKLNIQNEEIKKENKFDFLDMIIIIIMLVMCLVTKDYTDYYLRYAYIFVLISFIVYFVQSFIYNKNQTKYLIKLLTYSLSLVTIVLLRVKMKTNVDINTNDKYLKNWLPILFSNRIVFLNVFGNIILYVPFIYLLSKLLNNLSIYLIGIICIILISILELTQYIFNIGIFDVTDIYLNSLGILLFIIVKEVRKTYGRKRQSN